MRPPDTIDADAVLARELRFELPYPIPRELSPNGRAHWRTVAKAKRALSDLGYALVLEAIAQQDWTGKAQAVEVQYLVCYAGVPPDDDNLPVKYARDGIAAALGLPDDSPKHWRTLPVEYVKVAKRNQQKIGVRITEVVGAK